VPYFSAAFGDGNRNESLRAFQTDRNVTEFGQLFQIAPRSASEIDYRERRFTGYVFKKRGNILTDVVIAGADNEILRISVVVVQRYSCNFLKVIH